MSNAVWRKRARVLDLSGLKTAVRQMVSTAGRRLVWVPSVLGAHLSLAAAESDPHHASGSQMPRTRRIAVTTDLGIGTAMKRRAATRGEKWEDVETDLSRSWNAYEHRGTSTWEQMKEAVRDAWDRVTGKHTVSR